MQRLRLFVYNYNKLQCKIPRLIHEGTNSHCVIIAGVASTASSSRWHSSCLTPTRHRVGIGSCLHVDGIKVHTPCQAGFEIRLNAILERTTIYHSRISDLYARKSNKTLLTSSTLRTPVVSIGCPEKERFEVGRGKASGVTNGINSPGEACDWGLGVRARTS
jgi:hypothetical protein